MLASLAFALALGSMPALAESPTSVDPEVRANLIDALRRFVDKKPSSAPLDQRLAKRFAKLPGARKTATRLLAALDARQKPTTAKLELRATAGWKSLAVFQPHRHVSRSKLPAEGVVTATSYELRLAGIGCDASSDGDANGDEPIVLTSWATVGSGGLAVANLSVPADGTLTGVRAGAVQAEQQQIYAGAGVDALLVTAVVEDDDGSAATARADFELLMSMSLSMTDLLDDDPLTELEFAIGYTQDMLAAANPDRWGDRSIVATRVAKGQLADLWATAPDKTDGVAWKLRHDHETAGGKYGLLFDVPAPKAPETNKLIVRVMQVSDLDPDPKDTPDLTAYVKIRDATATKELPWNKKTHNLDWRVSRRVLPGKVKVVVEVDEHSECYASGLGMLACLGLPGPKPLDLDPGDGKALVFVVDPEQGTISGDVTGALGQTITVSGQKHPRGSVQLQVTYVD